MKDMMSLKKFWQEDGASVAIEYVILVAVCAMLLTAGAFILFNALSGFFSAWAGFFNAG